MHKKVIHGTGLSGLYELNAAGTILYSSLKTEDGLVRRRNDLAGVDFFGEVTQFSNVADFHHRFTRFLGASAPTETFDFSCEYNNEQHMFRVLMARLTKGQPADSYLIYIRNCAPRDGENVA